MRVWAASITFSSQNEQGLLVLTNVRYAVRADSYKKAHQAFQQMHVEHFAEEGRNIVYFCIEEMQSTLETIPTYE
jgi:hypothetical protein